MKSIILASGSPRRRELLEQVRIPFTVHVSTCEEIITKEVPSEVVLELSEQKAADIAASVSDPEKENSLIIGADTVVALNNQILGKPTDEKDAFSMLESLSGTSHQVYTGVTLIYWENGQKMVRSFYEQTEVFFYPLTSEQIRSYIATGEPMDKAGAYGIQGLAAAFVRRIEGDYYNVVGLPVSRLLQEMHRL
jgi:septum formation protein